jgi:hypothetical protein
VAPLDTSGDGRLTPLDVLLIINALYRAANADGEEFMAAAMPPDRSSNWTRPSNASDDKQGVRFAGLTYPRLLNRGDSHRPHAIRDYRQLEVVVMHTLSIHETPPLDSLEAMLDALVPIRPANDPEHHLRASS